MNGEEADESLLILVGELLYKNQLLREAVASKDDAIELIINHLMSAATAACSCGVADRLNSIGNKIKETDIELKNRTKSNFNDLSKRVDPIDSPADSRGMPHSELQKNRG